MDLTELLRESLIECDALPPGTLLMLPGPRQRVQDYAADGTPVVRLETLDEYARRCVALRVEAS